MMKTTIKMSSRPEASLPGKYYLASEGRHGLVCAMPVSQGRKATVSQDSGDPGFPTGIPIS